MRSVLQTEWIKIKSTPFMFLIFVATCVVPFFILVPVIFDAHNMTDLNKDPWSIHYTGVFAIFSVFVITPLIIMMTTTCDYVEHQAKANKFRYCTPVTRSQFYFGKAIFLVLMTIIAFLILPLVAVLSGYVVDWILPEYEYGYYAPELFSRYQFLKPIFIASLGIIGIQYFLTTYFKHFIIPLGIGIVGYIISFILSALNSPLSIWMPYDYPLVVRDLKMFKNEQNEAMLGDILTKVEVFSILVFILFLFLGWMVERNRNITE